MPDLKKMLTLEALSEALPSWLKRSTKPEYNADEIDSTLTTNQFVTASDKENWNAKGTYSKPSGGIPKSDLSSIVQTSLEKADSALQSETDPTVPSWAKQTNKPSYTQDEVADGSTYKRVTQTEKDAWSGKQNALTTTQMQAVNSGITSAGVAQISTNQTNILYGINNGVKNICDYVNPLQLNNCEIVDGEFKQTATDSKANLNFMASAVRSDGITYALFTTAPITTNGEYSYEFNFPTDAVAIRIGHNGTTRDAKFDINVDHFVVGTTYVISINVLNCVQSSGVYRFNKIMICTKQLWDTIGHGFMPPALPNYDLTRLEAEDRASLAEVVDSGAKNLWDFPNASEVSRNSLTITNNNDGSKTFTSENGNWQRAVYKVNVPSSGLYYLTAKVKNASLPTNRCYIFACPTASSSSNYYEMWQITGNGETHFSFNVTGDLYIWVYLNYSDSTGNNTLTLYDVMICTKAAFGVSKAFAPYRVPINGVFWAEKYEARSTTLVSTGIKFTASKQTIYRITATAQYGNSKPTQLVIKKKLIPSESEGFFVAVSSDTNSQSLTATGIMTLGVGGYFEVYAAYDGTTSNRVYAIVEEVVL